MQALVFQNLRIVVYLKEWSGVRPTNNEMPLMDQIDDGLFVITGHYRNGILLSPVIGRDIANWLISGIKTTPLFKL